MRAVHHINDKPEDNDLSNIEIVNVEDNAVGETANLKPYVFMGERPTQPAPYSKPIPRPKRTGPPPPPLRKVVDTCVMVDVSTRPSEYKMEVRKWQLECGHTVTPPSDIYGERYPNRMRCRQCTTL